MREVQLPANVALGQRAAEHSQDHELAGAEVPIAVSVWGLRRVLEGRKALRQDPRIRARVENRLRLGDRIGRRLVSSQRLENGDVVEKPGHEWERVPRGAKYSDAALENRQGLLEPLPRSERRAQGEICPAV